MLLTEEVELRWNNRFKSYYESKGYVFTKQNDEFIVKIEDVLPNSNKAIVDVLCDYCKTNIVSKTYQNYNKEREIIQKDCCKECSSKKTKEVSKLKYGVESWTQLESSKKQIGNANKKYTQKEVEDIFENKGYELLSVYKNYKTKLDFLCKKHIDLGIQQTTLNSVIKSKHNCKECISSYKSKIRKIYNQDEVILIFKDKGLTLLNEYKNYNQVLEYVCDVHPEIGIQKTTLYDILNNKRICLKCADNVSGMCLTLGYVKDLFNNHNLTLVSNEYKNSSQELEFICNNHSNSGIQICTLNQLRKNICVCKECKKEIKQQKNKEYQDVLQNEMIKNGIFPLRDWEYKDVYAKIPYICMIHYDEIQYITPKKLKKGRGCKYCGINKNKGSNHYNWQGGISNLNSYLRSLLRPLIDEKLKEYNYKCYLSGKNETLEIHHLYSFSSIVDDVLSELHLPVKEDIGLYTDDDIIAIENLFMKKHNGNWGVPLLPEIHHEFHKKYGLIKNTEEQFYDFAKKFEYYNNKI